MIGVILRERGPERFRGPKERQLFGVGSGVVSEESAFAIQIMYAGIERKSQNRAVSF